MGPAGCFAGDGCHKMPQKAKNWLLSRYIFNYYLQNTTPKRQEQCATRLTTISVWALACLQKCPNFVWTNVPNVCNENQETLASYRDEGTPVFYVINPKGWLLVSSPVLVLIWNVLHCATIKVHCSSNHFCRVHSDNTNSYCWKSVRPSLVDWTTGMGHEQLDRIVVFQTGHSLSETGACRKSRVMWKPVDHLLG